jgi:hypothetical protein
MTQTANTIAAKEKPTGKPWWHYGLAWLVFGGPAAVVVACMVTIYLAVNGQDPVLDHDYYQKGININSELEAKEAAKLKALSIAEKNALEPAGLARNHAATGVNQK